MTTPTKLEEALDCLESMIAEAYLVEEYASHQPTMEQEAAIASARAAVLAVVRELAGAGKSLSDSYAGLYGPSHPKVRRMDAALALVPREES